MDRDMINIVHYLYHHGTIRDEDVRKMVQCHSDTMEPLRNSKILKVARDTWGLSQGVVDFIRMAEENLEGV